MYTFHATYLLEKDGKKREKILRGLQIVSDESLGLEYDDPKDNMIEVKVNIRVETDSEARKTKEKIQTLLSDVFGSPINPVLIKTEIIG
ncbi:hypothetical protein C4565_01750 [Candidatus Parcubacteria bacterium]|jgi:hypothetical protein|nr:MAG: hypothetical protein C4565_01750 [Candidatus Parcubacteria bacterium]